MGFFDFFRTPAMDDGIREFAMTPGAVLLDVRTPAEYRQGHIPESKNIPLQTIEAVGSVVEQKDTPLFVYCQSGARSRQAAAALKQMGYTNIKDLGGISAYTGKVVK